MSIREDIRRDDQTKAPGAESKEKSLDPKDKIEEQKRRTSDSKNENDLKRSSDQGSEDESKQFDFGGLPNRNLKKNLGCG